MCRHIYDWNIVNCDVKQPIYLTLFLFIIVYIVCIIKICYDKAGNLPNKDRNFNTQTWGNIVYFLFVWLVGIGFRQNFFRVLPNFGDFGAKISFFHYIINQKRNNFIKHCSLPPVYQEAADIRDVYLYKKFAVQVGYWYTGGGGTMLCRQKTKGVSAYNTQNTLLYPSKFLSI